MTDNRTNAIDYTERGFGIYADFKDRYREHFTVQQSSLATEDAVWIGVHEKRGHLTVEMAQHVRDALTGWLQDVGAEEDGAALVAAQCAAPPVNSFGTSTGRVKNGADSLHVEPQAESDCWHEANCSCPSVQPSSGVDEDKLAEVIARVTDLWDDPLDEVHDIPQIARAVAEWLKGQGR